MAEPDHAMVGQSAASSQPGARRKLRYAVFAVIVLAAIAALVLLVPRSAGPPRSITLATGVAGGAYAELGPRYQKILARSGVRCTSRRPPETWTTWRSCAIDAPR